jgi:hypothetical protein
MAGRAVSDDDAAQALQVYVKEQGMQVMFDSSWFSCIEDETDFWWQMTSPIQATSVIV